jgi:hypothetical protein
VGQVSGCPCCVFTSQRDRFSCCLLQLRRMYEDMEGKVNLALIHINEVVSVIEKGMSALCLALSLLLAFLLAPAGSHLLC